MLRIFCNFSIICMFLNTATDLLYPPTVNNTFFSWSRADFYSSFLTQFKCCLLYKAHLQPTHPIQ